MQKIAEGGVDVPNPFNRQVYHVPLKPETTAAIVFWSKNYRPFLDKLPLLEKQGYDKFLFNFTITGHPKLLEPNIPPAEECIDDLIELSARYGKDKIFWRFDPVLMPENGDYSIIKNFNRLADKIAPHAGRCIFSFTFFYKKVIRSLKKIADEYAVTYSDPKMAIKKDIAAKLAETAADHGLPLHACCCDYLLEIPGIEKSNCIDGELISQLWDDEYVFRAAPSRPNCGCAESSDIGTYGTCKSGCIYCYAN